MSQPSLHQAAYDFFILQNRPYPFSSSLEMVGNRYQLPYLPRQMLHRGVFGQSPSLGRRAKRCLSSAWQTAGLVIDGRNVQGTVGSAILERPLLFGSDAALRDLARQWSHFHITRVSELALRAIMRFLSETLLRKAPFLFDAPESHNG